MLFREVTIKDAPLLMEWRTSERVDSMMLSTISDRLDDQIKWLSSCFERNDYYHWIINDGETDIGLVSINLFNPDVGSTSWGYYIGEENKIGAGATVPAYFYNFIFSKSSPIEYVTAEILETNQKVIRMHSIYGYETTPDLDRFVIREGFSIKLKTMRLTRRTWEEKTQFHKFVADFPMENWRSKPISHFTSD